MKPTIQLIELQTYLISKGETMIDETGYKQTPEVLKILAKLWGEASKNEQKHLEKLIAGTDYTLQ